VEVIGTALVMMPVMFMVSGGGMVRCARRGDVTGVIIMVPFLGASVCGYLACGIEALSRDLTWGAILAVVPGAALVGFKWLADMARGEEDGDQI